MECSKPVFNRKKTGFLSFQSSRFLDEREHTYQYLNGQVQFPPSTYFKTGLIILFSNVVCTTLSVSVDEWKKQASSDKSKQMRNSEKREGESLSTSFQIPQSTHHLAYFPKNHFSCQNVKCCSSKVWCRRVLQLDMYVRLWAHEAKWLTEVLK